MDDPLDNYYKIKARTIPYQDGKGKHLRIFLMADNYGFLPQKGLIRFGENITEVVDGKPVEHRLRWYQCCDPFEYLKDYKIMQYLKRKDPEPHNETDSNPANEDVTVPPEAYCAPCTFPVASDKTSSVKKRRAMRK